MRLVFCDQSFNRVVFHKVFWKGSLLKQQFFTHGSILQWYIDKGMVQPLNQENNWFPMLPGAVSSTQWPETGNQMEIYSSLCSALPTEHHVLYP